ncbi:MAG: FlgK family flagellar hook-associated protein, partial [bacterium]
ELIDVEEGTNTQGRDLLVVGGGAALAGQRAMKLELIDLGNGQVGLAPRGISTPMPITGGKIRALLEAQNQTIPDMQDRLAALAQQIVRAVDQQHAKGVPDTGAFTVLLGQRAVSSVTDPLNRSDTDFPLNAGDVYV